MKLLIDLYYYDNINRDFITTIVFNYSENTTNRDLKLHLLDIFYQKKPTYLGNTLTVYTEASSSELSPLDDTSKICDMANNNIRLKAVIFNIHAPQNAKLIAEIDGIRIYFGSDERRHYPHIHAEYGGNVVKIRLDDSTQIEGKISPNKMKIVLKYINKNRNELIERYWKDTNAGWHLKNNLAKSPTSS